jgi:gamma-D-glutamyl-L-lysine dipeptidyl-peptidase
MEQYICENVFVPLRSAPSHKSEMLSQVIFGEKYFISDRAGSWIKVETLFDKYSGWLDTAHLQHTVIKNDIEGSVLNRPLLCYKNDNTKMILEAGCEIYNPDYENKTFSVGENVYNTVHEFGPGYISAIGSIPQTAMNFINSPYIWGGRIPSGIDCSGLTQLVYKIHGIAIARDSFLQAEEGTNIDFIDAAEAGDLVFFDNDRGKISHVGIIISRGLVIHASGRVRLDSIDHQGIYKYETGGYSHHLRMIKRIV